MRRTVQSLTFIIAMLSAAALARAQSPVSATGHWEGTIDVPDHPMRIEIDLERTSEGHIEGTIAVPEQKLKGLPLSRVTLDDLAIDFSARTDQLFAGSLSDEGRSMTGRFEAQGLSLPFRMTRAGDARMEPPLTSPAVGREFEGSWTATLDVNGTPLRLVLQLANHADGTSAGSVTNLDEGDLRVPVAIAQQPTVLTLDAPAVGASYTGTLNADATELTGTFRQGPLVAPLRFTRTAPPDRSR